MLYQVFVFIGDDEAPTHDRTERPTIATISIAEKTPEAAIRSLQEALTEATAEMEAAALRAKEASDDPTQAPQDIAPGDHLQTPAYIENAVKFCQKRHFSPRCIEFYRMLEHARGDIISGLYGAWCVGYRRGYNRAHRKFKATSKH